MGSTVKNSGRIAYGVKSMVFDTLDDLRHYDPVNLATGSTAFIIDSSTHYMLNSKKVWIKVNLSNGGGGNVDPDVPSDSVIYDGGEIIG